MLPTLNLPPCSHMLLNTIFSTDSLTPPICAQQNHIDFSPPPPPLPCLLDWISQVTLTTLATSCSGSCPSAPLLQFCKLPTLYSVQSLNFLTQPFVAPFDAMFQPSYYPHGLSPHTISLLVSVATALPPSSSFWSLHGPKTLNCQTEHFISTDQTRLPPRCIVSIFPHFLQPMVSSLLHCLPNLCFEASGCFNHCMIASMKRETSHQQRADPSHVHQAYIYIT